MHISAYNNTTLPNLIRHVRFWFVEASTQICLWFKRATASYSELWFIGFVNTFHKTANIQPSAKHTVKQSNYATG